MKKTKIVNSRLTHLERSINEYYNSRWLCNIKTTKVRLDLVSQLLCIQMIDDWTWSLVEEPSDIF